MPRHPLDFLLADPDDEGPGRRSPERSKRDDADDQFTGSPWHAVPGLHPPRQRMDVIEWCRSQGESLLVALRDGVSYHRLFWVYTAGDTIFQCRLEYFRLRLRIYGETQGVVLRRGRKGNLKSVWQTEASPAIPAPRFRHFWERGLDSAGLG